MFRPLTLIGAFVIGFSILSYLLIPGLRYSGLGIGVLIFCIAIGFFAIVKDLRDFWKEIEKQRKSNGDK